MSKDAYYFSHDSNARSDEKILELRDVYGWAGYGMFWAIIEMLRDSPDYTLSNSIAMLKQCLNIDKTLAQEFYNHCIKLELLIENEGRFYSESLMKRMEEIDEKRRKRADAGRKGGNAKAMLKQNPSNALAKASKESKVNESKIKEKKECNNSKELLETNKLSFHNSLIPFVQEFSKDTVRAFYDYWSEVNKNNKMKWELQKTWETNLRLSTWKRNENNFNKNGTNKQNTAIVGATSKVNGRTEFGGGYEMPDPVEYQKIFDEAAGIKRD